MADVRALEFGVHVPIGWRSEFHPITDPTAQWETTVAVARLAEDLGFDAIWAGDHLHTIPGRDNTSVFDSWTVLTALCQHTTRVRFGHMVSCAAFRSPAIVAKMTATLDVMSGGRLIWGVGAGWHEEEFRAYGFPFGTGGERVGALREAVEIVKLMWSEPAPVYHGRFFSIDGARCDPKPLQDPHPPVLIGAWGEQLGSWLVAEHADRCNFPTDNDTVAAKLAVLRDRCRAIGRDEGEIMKTWTGELHIREDESEIIEGPVLSLYPVSMEEWRRSHIIGTPQQVCERIQELIDIGITGFTFSICELPDVESMHLFAKQVLPAFRSAPGKAG